MQRTMGRVRRRVTFSRNLTLSLSRTCRCYCKYCAFATHKPHLHEPAEVEKILDGAVKRNVKELLVLTGEAPDHHPGVAAKLAELGHADFTAYVVWVCERALERGLLPHTNLGVLSREDLGRLREVTASQGLMLESVNPDLVAHQGSPTKHPELRLECIRTAGELKIPFTSGILVGIGETEDERVAALEALAAVHAEHGHLQEVILQNFVPHQSYYGQEPAEIAEAASKEYWRTGLGEGPALDRPAWSTPVGIEDMKRLIAETQRLLPGRRRPGPAEPRRLVARARRGGRDRPRRPERQRRPHLARAPVPVAAQGPQAPGRGRRGADRAAVRLRRVHRPRVGGPGRARRHQDELLELHPAPRAPAPAHPAAPGRSPCCTPPPSPAPATASRSRRRRSRRCSPRRAPRRSRTCAPPPTSCARSSRGTR